MGKTEKIILTPEQEAWLLNHFKHTRNEDVAEKLGISLRSVSRIANKTGLKKSKQFIRKCQLDAAEKAKRYHMANGTYPPKGYAIPNREKGYFQKGVKPIERLGAQKDAERAVKAQQSRMQTWRLEKARALYGLPRQTKLLVVRRPRKQTMLRYYLKKLGYIIERGSCVAYYDKRTKRSLTLESKPMTGFTFLEFTN